MNPARWNEISEAFWAVLDQSPDQRAGFLDATFSNDPALHDELVRLLKNANDAEHTGFLREPAWVIGDIPLLLPDFKHSDSEFSSIEYIGQGGMGVVYKAYQKNFDRWVALKFSSLARACNASETDRFRAEAQNMARLRHPNIVTVHEIGEHEGRPFFVMELIEGKSLSECVSDFVPRPKDAAALVEKLAQAVHHAHQRRVLHNDLKPANILLDEEGQPHVTDFGLARRFEKEFSPSVTSAIEGTASYMSPEQAEGREITTTSDVYGLGAILYTLLVGAPPFRGDTVQETLQLVQSEPVKSPRTSNPGIDLDLAAICLKCLAKHRTQRYASANALAQDLVRYRNRQETTARPWSARERLLNWCRRNVMEAWLLSAVVAIWIFAMVMAFSVAQARKAHILQATLSSAGFAAKDLAQTALLQLRHLSRSVEIVIADPQLSSLLARNDRDGLQRIVHEVCRSQPIPFMTCYVTNRDGVMVAHAPPADYMIGGDFSWRDHFRGAKALAGQNAAGAVHISRVYRGRSDNLYKFAISAPILDRDRNFLGVIATSVTTDATMGLVFLHDDSRKVALVAPTDIDHPAESSSGKHVVLYHPGYRQAINPVEFPYIERIRSTVNPANKAALGDSKLLITHDDHYIDPVGSVAKEYQGRWIAGFAPVGNTGFLVVVQQRFEDAVSLEWSTVWNLVIWSALATLVAIAILLIVIWRWGTDSQPTNAGEE